MKAQPVQRTVEELISLHRASMLRANPEYQRGIVWGLIHKKKLIDSILRGYPIPLIYLHHIKTSVAGMQREDLEVIDGQQRIHALYEFIEGGFKLLDPKLDEKIARFPKFIRDQPCPWAGRDYGLLAPELQQRLMQTLLSVAMIETDDPNEVRDLFVRLQSGLPLNSQETRDAWPGDFTDYILRLGGKPELARYPGHDFFTAVLRMKPRTDRGKTRTLAAQIAMLFLTRRWHGEGIFPDINAPAINDFYYANLAFASDSESAGRLRSVLDALTEIFRGGKHPKLHGHDAIHLVLLADALYDDYAPVWKERLPKALDEFMRAFADSKFDYDSEYWTKYGVWTRTNSDRGTSISIRHQYYVERMMKFMSPLTKKDPTRLFGEAERTLLYYRQSKRCGVCQGEMKWSDCEIHHLVEHSKGGATSLENGLAVHKACHPKGAQATALVAAAHAHTLEVN